jgi:hypothetical protein
MIFKPKGQIVAIARGEFPEIDGGQVLKPLGQKRNASHDLWGGLKKDRTEERKGEDI